VQAFLLEKPQPIERAPLRAANVPKPTARLGELLIRVTACGLCHTDLHTVEGDIALPRTPIIPGHQVVGIVESLGQGVTGPAVGRRVGVAWLHQTCGKCRFCTTGRENLCPDARFTGLDADGGYAEYMTAVADFTYPIPEGFPDEQAAPLLCAGIIGFRALRQSRVQPGERLGLFGFGASAHVTIQVARHWGCPVYVFTRSPRHQALARRLGAAWVGKVPDRPPVRLDAAINFAPSGELVPPALENLAPGGTLALAGIHMTDTPPLDYQKHLYREKSLVSVTAATRQDGRDLLALAAEIPIRTEVQVFPFEEANRALEMLKRSEISGATVLRIS